MNHQSSRSHTLFRLHIDSFMKVDNATTSVQSNVVTESILVKINLIIMNKLLINYDFQNFVDLAGSEKVSNHS